LSYAPWEIQCSCGRSGEERAAQNYRPALERAQASPNQAILRV